MTANKVKRLKDEMGIPLFEAKKVLDQVNGDYDKAIGLVYEDGMRIAKQRRAKLTKASTIACYDHGKHRLVTIVEVACESDLTASADFFQSFANDIAKHITATGSLYLDKKEVKEEDIAQLSEEERIDYYQSNCLLQQKYYLDPTRSVDEMVLHFVYQHKENIEIKRFMTYKARRDV